MQLSDKPDKLVLPFADSGSKNAISETSLIGVTPGAASLPDGFPPLTRTPLAAGGVPPSGLDMNGILYLLSAIARWKHAGGGDPYDSTFANNTNVGGYPKGARVLRSDGLGYWLNTADDNVTDPESSGAAAAGWVPDMTSGATSITMTSSNVTLAPLQYGKPIILITGTLSANVNLIFPAIAGARWTVVNGCTGDYTITCKTAAGTGVIVKVDRQIICDGVNIRSGNSFVAPSAGGNYFMQIGSGTASTGGVANTFDDPFPNDCLIVIPITSGVASGISYGVEPISASGFTVYSSTGTPAIVYLAIGY